MRQGRARPPTWQSVDRAGRRCDSVVHSDDSGGGSNRIEQWRDQAASFDLAGQADDTVTDVELDRRRIDAELASQDVVGEMRAELLITAEEDPQQVRAGHDAH